MVSEHVIFFGGQPLSPGSIIQSSDERVYHLNEYSLSLVKTKRMSTIKCFEK
jgi:hypothetical protein